MSDYDLRADTISVFLRLRPNGVPLGIGELLAALKIIDEHFVAEDRLLHMLQLLWCKSDTDRWHLETIWKTLHETSMPIEHKPPVETPKTDSELKTPTTNDDLEQKNKTSFIPPTPMPQMQPLPLQAPVTLLPGSNAPELRPYWPVSRRFMSYMWRYLRRTVFEGPCDVFDLDATIAAIAHNGQLLEVVYRRREVNTARMILLLDHRGSMTPFHRYLRDLVITLEESDVTQYAVYYFRNAPDEYLYSTPYLTGPIPLSEILDRIDENVSVLIVSDAGAARGRPRSKARGRVQATLQFLARLRHSTQHVAWLNPMPIERWDDTAAATIARSVPMFQMDEYGFSNAIDVLSGRRSGSIG